MFDKILLPLDGSSLAEHVLPHAVGIARAFESDVTLIQVLDQRQPAGSHPVVDPLNWQIGKAEAENYLDDQALRLQKNGLRVEKQILEGHAPEQIVEFSRTHEISLILVSSHGSGGLSEWSVSSVVQKIILRAHTSIMIIRAYQPVAPEATELRYSRLLLPLDGSQRAECVLPAANTLAHFYDAEILLVHVVRKPEMPRRTPPTRDDLELVDELVQRNEAEAKQYLDQVKSQFPGKTEARVVISDQPAATLHELVNQEQTDLTLLCAHGYSALRLWPYGSVVSSFITYGSTPLLIVQDLSADNIRPTQAELAARARGS